MGASIFGMNRLLGGSGRVTKSGFSAKELMTWALLYGGILECLEILNKNVNGSYVEGHCQRVIYPLNDSDSRFVHCHSFLRI